MAVDESDTHVWGKQKKAHSGGQSSISTNNCGENIGKDIICYCGLKAVRLIAKAKANPGRAFYTCRLPKGDPAKCGFFAWADNVREEVEGFGSSVHEILLKKVGSLEAEVRRLTYCVSALSMMMFIFMMFWIIGPVLNYKKF